MMEIIEIVLGLLIAVAALALLAPKFGIPHPILLVIGGLLLTFVPKHPPIRLDPDLIFLTFLPPLLYPAALFSPWRDFRANLRPILLLAIGLVLFTILTVGYAAHYLIPDFPLAAAFVLGAIISPPDAIAATAIAQRLPVPSRIITILEGESLVNDATALVAYRFGVAAVVTGVFSFSRASGQFFLVGIGGILIGLGIGVITAWIQQRLDDPPVQTTLSLLTPFAVYLPAERLGVSGVLAVVSAGLYHGWRSPEIVNARTRLQAGPVWETIEFILNGLIFILIGLQLPEVLRGLPGYSALELFWYASAISLTVILVRIIWVFAATYLPRLLSKKLRENDPYPSWRHVLIIAWTGMRGVVSLAAALALPLTVQNGSAFPGRHLILFLTFSVILVTLVVQGLSLPPIIRWLGVVDDRTIEREEHQARLKANEAALARLNELSESNATSKDALDRLRTEYEDRIRQLASSQSEENGHRWNLFSSEYEQLSYETLQVERKIILQLRNDEVINDEVLRHIQRDIDLAEARLRFPNSAT